MHQREVSSIRCKAVVRCARYGLHTTGFRVANARAPLHWLSLEFRCSTRACDALAVRHDGRGRLTLNGRPLHQQEPPYSVQDRAATCPQRPRTHSRLLRDKRTGAPLCWLSLGRRRSTHACDLRAPHRKGCDRSMQYLTAMHQREVSSIRCKVVVRCARCGLPHNQLLRGKRAGATLLAISCIVAQHARLRRARGAPRWLWSVHAPWKATASARGLLFGARPCCDVSTVSLEHTAGFHVKNARARHH